jgi:hypothetical protein
VLDQTVPAEAAQRLVDPVGPVVETEDQAELVERKDLACRVEPGDLAGLVEQGDLVVPVGVAQGVVLGLGLRLVRVGQGREGQPEGMSPHAMGGRTTADGD